tara:strand:- start:1085 stop:1291 length:207 start_codon:yes stop_codon:yes gene_type:complete
MTPNQVKVLEFIKKFIADNSYSPSYEEIALHMNWKARSQVHNVIRQLEKRKYITYLPNHSRSVVINEQ